jgi:hypothetical protein
MLLHLRDRVLALTGFHYLLAVFGKVEGGAADHDDRAVF